MIPRSKCKRLHGFEVEWCKNIPIINNADGSSDADMDGASYGHRDFDTLDLAMSVASQSTGVAIGDWALIGEDLSTGRLVTPFDLKVRTGAAYYLVYPERSDPSPQLRELIDWLLTQAAERADSTQ